MANEIPLPNEDELTVKWLIEHVPVRWWLAFAGTFFGAFSAGYGIAFWGGTESFSTSATEIIELESRRSELNAEIQQLEIAKQSLKVEVSALEIKSRYKGMTEEELRDAMLKNAQPDD